MHAIDLNCDLGEGYPADALLMPWISSANIACGYHAGDIDTMKRTVALCLEHGVAIGAHPSYPDRENFGRTDMMDVSLSVQDLPYVIEDQISLLLEICIEAGAKLHHVKPHGALYNRAAKDKFVCDAICVALKVIDPTLVLYGLSGSDMEVVAKNTGIAFMREVFADRTYQHDGSLRPRNLPDALITNEEQSLQQVLQMINEGTVRTVDNKIIPMRAETICIHGDGSHAVAFARRIHEELLRNGVLISSQGM
jgi:5-oxoprolinase (ATP-hydrolysing) subunit A